MKKLVIAFILGIALKGNAQDLTDWQIGLNLNPFIFSRINGNENLKKDKQIFPNGFGFGLTIEKNWNEHWGIKTGFESCKQNQKYSFFYSNSSLNQFTINADFTYYKIPLTIQYYYPIKGKLFLTINQGFQYSILNKYKILEDNHYSGYTIRENGIHEVIDNVVGNQKAFEESPFKKTLFGIIGSIGLKGFILDELSYSTNLRYEYDLTKSDIYGITVFDNSGNWGDITNSKNFRIGLELGIQYHFSLDKVFFDGRPHRI